ncbi:hypothetical protein PG994_008626 [Apiospora phragmitis]|uniref:Uncharacterized protein n=1 Tax=Apiospora phragmitis TaxID=2905665 RepID=A0ABR1UH20_9PEZI
MRMDDGSVEVRDAVREKRMAPGDYIDPSDIMATEFDDEFHCLAVGLHYQFSDIYRGGYCPLNMVKIDSSLIEQIEKRLHLNIFSALRSGSYLSAHDAVDKIQRGSKHDIGAIAPLVPTGKKNCV